MGEFTILLIFIGGIFFVFMPFVAIWNIWTLLQKIEKINQSINNKLIELVDLAKKEIE